MSKELSNNKLKIAVVTGAGSGIGLSITLKLLKSGHVVYACTGSRTRELKKLFDSSKQTLQERFFIKKFDINDYSLTKELAQEIFKKFKRIDILINSAGIPYGNLFQLTKTADLVDVFQTNYFSLLAFTQLISRIMGRNKKGSIVNISSTTAFRADSGTLAYGSAKAALNYATKVLSKELAPQGIRVNAVAPGVTETSMLRKMDIDEINKQIESSSLKKVASPEQVASLVLFLCSEDSSHVTGQIIKVDGGQ